MILLLIEKIKETGNVRFVPLLRAWQAIEYKKVQAELQNAVNYLLQEGQIKYVQDKETNLRLSKGSGIIILKSPGLAVLRKLHLEAVWVQYIKESQMWIWRDRSTR